MKIYFKKGGEMIDIEDLLLLIENKQVDLEYSSSFNDKEDLNKKKSQIEILDWLVEEIKKMDK